MYNPIEIIKNDPDINCFVIKGDKIPIANIIFARLNNDLPASLYWFSFNLNINIIYNLLFKSQ